MHLCEDELENFVRSLAVLRGGLQGLIKHSGDDRVFEPVWEAEDVNAWLICWSERHDTGWHDHNDSAAAIFVLEGKVREERLRLGAVPGSRVIGPGATFYVPPTAIHRVLHAGSGPAVTLHAYSPPLTRTGAYWLGPDGELRRISQAADQELRPALASAEDLFAGGPRQPTFAGGARQPTREPVRTRAAALG